ncbi:uncharacterized protein EI90DRAFT_1594606 [Cantharellus anzutake]|uniref:uncharacterized protein n=1 Tax=Cantharellus anzutake TaxID=1750568 RepID=UPI001908C9ED|nr:uncharacterized protein EI90DRAFT_1594606 [Cantharellus anzutake]KAF8328055.1 hypothetical protein EI90DRAFT_1594606 [Cantharellus anzutake]
MRTTSTQYMTSLALGSVRTYNCEDGDKESMSTRVTPIIHGLRNRIDSALWNKLRNMLMFRCCIVSNYPPVGRNRPSAGSSGNSTRTRYPLDRLSSVFPFMFIRPYRIVDVSNNEIYDGPGHRVAGNEIRSGRPLFRDTVIIRAHGSGGLP